MTDWQAVAGKVLNGIRKAGGRTATVTVFADTLRPDGSIESRTPTDYQVPCTPVLPNPGRRQDAQGAPRVDGIVYAAASGIPITPAEGQTWQVDGVRYTSHSVDTYTAGGVLLAFAIQLRQGAVAAVAP